MTRTNSAPLDATATTSRTRDAWLKYLPFRDRTVHRLVSSPTWTPRAFASLLRSLVGARTSSEILLLLTLTASVSLWLCSVQLHAHLGFSILQRLGNCFLPHAQVLEQERRPRRQSERHLQDIQVMQHPGTTTLVARTAHAPRRTPRFRPWKLSLHTRPSSRRLDARKRKSKTRNGFIARTPSPF